jgi:hypothetical protein
MRHELRAVVEAHLARRPMLDDKAIEYIGDATGVGATIARVSRVNSSITFNSFTVRP